MRKPLLVAGGIVVITILCLLAWRYFRNSAEPVMLDPAGDYAVAEVEFFLQNDTRWANDTLGDSRFKMSSSGCLVSCLASALAEQGIDTDPGRLNQAFTEQGVYNSEGEIIWDRISKVYPGVHVISPDHVDASELEDALSQGLLPIVRVKYMGTGYQHWVLLIGADNGDYLCMDPLNADKEPLALSKHGGIIYRYRIIKAAP